jgi:hypothetical protein
MTTSYLLWASPLTSPTLWAYQQATFKLGPTSLAFHDLHQLAHWQADTLGCTLSPAASRCTTADLTSQSETNLVPGLRARHPER